MSSLYNVQDQLLQELQYWCKLRCPFFLYKDVGARYRPTHQHFLYKEIVRQLLAVRGG